MIEWNKEHSIGLSIIDEEHKKVIEIINGIIFAKQRDNDPKEIEEMLHEMIDYALSHFKTEESYMLEFNYHEYQYHKEEHVDFIHRMNSYVSRVVHGNCKLASEILEFLKQWLVRHIEGTDKRYIESFVKNGLT
ncbi:MAG: hemerythrin family protein [Candidatus Brocadiales bacterium]|nr:hemerythrin family protein [Candidatus Brocadiales bacterium]